MQVLSHQDIYHGSVVLWIVGTRHIAKPSGEQVMKEFPIGREISKACNFDHIPQSHGRF